ncbi:MAG TPA: ATP-grasp domain-containing protein [Candidatus Eisenbacteria bacterium]|jgi:ribosomal protein S6--L-glutamate ligase
MKRIGFLMVSHPRSHKSPIMAEVVRLLSEWGAKVQVIHPERQLLDLSRLRVEHDLYILKARTDIALSIAGCLHAQGAAILNPYPVSMLLRDKIITSRVLQAAGLPTPATYVATRPEQLARLLEEGPLVVKPYRGSGGDGVRIVWDVDELDSLPTDHDVVFAQRYHKPEGPDRKIYCIQGQVFGVLRGWPARSYEEKLGEPFTITPELRDIALRCGEAFGIDLYGLDIIQSAGTHYVVDVCSFPGFKGVPDAALRVADYINWAGDRVLAGESLATPARGGKVGV